MTDAGDRRRASADAMLDPRVIDPRQELVHYEDMDADELAQLVRVLIGIRRWREAEQRVSFQSRNHMHLGENDMKALRFLIAEKNQGITVTAGALSEHLGISTASTTKLLDRLAASGHIERSPHPTDRRALAISITKQTHEQVRDSVGRQHARRFEVVARMSSADREAVIRFLDDLSGPAQSDTPAVNDADAPTIQSDLPPV